MPRPERPIDPAEGPVPVFAAELRALRAASGLTYRNLADLAHFSKATLSSAAAGYRLPTWEVTRAYVSACGADPEDWRDRWQTAAAPLPPAVPVAADHAQPLQPADEPAGPVRRRWVARTILVMAAAAVLIVAAIGVTWFEGIAKTAARSPARAAAPLPRLPGSRTPVADNGDPALTRCADDPRVVTLDSLEIDTAAQNLLGIAQLRYSPRCRAAWGRFEPSGRMTLAARAVIIISARRPATGTPGIPYSVTFDGQDAYGNILMTRRGCVDITVTVRAASGGGTGTTRCER
jgi:transcriptional regulator with XRE-family HTH domain